MVEEREGGGERFKARACIKRRQAPGDGWGADEEGSKDPNVIFVLVNLTR